MENRQKNYGSVHDTKASMMYNRFLKQYNEWLSGGPIPDTGNQDIKYFLCQQRKRLEKRGLHRDSSIELRGLLASAGAIPPKVGKKYTNVTEFRTAQRNTTYSRGGRIIGKFRKKEILYQTITFANEATVDGTEPCTCPSCGAVNKGKFCAECGAKRPAGAPVYQCDKCGWKPEDPAHPPKFCPECGDLFDENDRVQ